MQSCNHAPDERRRAAGRVKEGVSKDFNEGLIEE